MLAITSRGLDLSLSLNLQSESSEEKEVDRTIQISSRNLEPSRGQLCPFSELEKQGRVEILA